jgi:hypothetical protein
MSRVHVHYEQQNDRIINARRDGQEVARTGREPVRFPSTAFRCPGTQ